MPFTSHTETERFTSLLLPAGLDSLHSEGNTQGEKN